jgi:hypothetical protein
MSGWNEAYDAQMDAARFWNSEAGIDYAKSFAGDVANKGRAGADMFAEAAKIEYGKLLQANPIYLDEEMFDLWEHATKSFQPEPLEPSDLITMGGFAYLPKPQYTFDVRLNGLSRKRRRPRIATGSTSPSTRT